MVKDLIRYYWSIAWSHKRYSLPPLFIAPFARIGSEFISPLIAAEVINKVSSDNRPPMRSLFWYVVGFFAIPLIAELLWRIVIWSLNRADALGMEKIANDTFKNLMSRSHDFHINNFAGSLVAKTNRFISAYEPIYDMLVFDIMGTVVSLIFAVVILTKISWPVGLAFIVILMIFTFIIYKLTRKRFRYNAARAEQESLQTAQLADSLTNAITVKTFAKEKHEQKLFEAISKNLLKKRLKAWDYQNIPMDVVTTNTIFVMNTLTLVGSIYAVYRLGAEVGTVFLMLSYVKTLTGKFWDFSRIMRSLESNLSNGVEMMTILKTPLSVTDTKSAEKIGTIQGNITFSKVSFSYEAENKNMLFENLNLVIPAGQSVGLVGPSGGGKTTITKLLLRFMDVRDGDITLDDKNISLMTQTSLREVITYVPQEPLLFHRSLKENIAYGKPSATMKQIIAAAKKAHAHDFIEKLPNGYDTLVGERGIKLSGGQRQRVALARAILKDAPIIVLDEATSALDSESEKLIQDALFTLMEGRTTIVIAHRLSTIKHLDRILVLEDGKVTEDGNHSELIKKKDGTYAQLWAHQSGGFIE